MEESQTQKILEKLAQALPANDARLQNYLLALQNHLKQDAKKSEQLQGLLVEYEEAYQKLTSPANRVGVLLANLEEERLLIAQGDTEFVALIDPKYDKAALCIGCRVLLNEAYAVIGSMPPHPAGMIMKVGEALADGRLRVSADVQNNQGRLVIRSEELSQKKIEKGDEVRIEPSGRVALEHFPHQEVRDYFVEEVQEIPWSAIGGQSHAIRLIRDTIEQPMLYPDLYSRFDKKPIKGILLYGPPGCGKTLIGKAIAYNLAREYSQKVGHEVKEYFMHISGPKILNMWLGETERMVREIFDTARSRAREGRLVVVFIDEAESVLRTRSSGKWLNISNTVVPQFCAEMDGLISLENVVLVLTSNRPDYIDPAVLRPERIDRKVKISRPDRDASREILSIYLHETLPIDPELLEQHDNEPSCARKALIEATLNHLWAQNSQTEFLKVIMKSSEIRTLFWKDLISGALLKSVVDRAKDIAIQRAIEQPLSGVSIQDMQQALEAEFRENEIFPKSDVMEDWLRLIDLEPENVATIKPVRSGASDYTARKGVI